MKLVATQKGSTITTGGVYFFNSRILFHLAKEAYGRSKGAPDDLSPGQYDAIAAILLSAATLESFIMEFALLADSGAESFGQFYPMLRKVADVIHEIEESRGSTRLKFILAKLIVGSPFIKGAAPYQEFDFLLRLRDAVAHMKPEWVGLEPPNILRGLQARKLCAEEEPNTRASWLYLGATRATARWSCNVVADIVASFRHDIPLHEGSHFETILNTPVWSAGFERVT